MAQASRRRTSAARPEYAPAVHKERIHAMKRFLLVLLFTAAFFGLVAAPALATTPGTGFRLPEKTAYIFAYGDGSWFEVTDVAAGTFAVHDARTPIPQNYDVAFQISFKTCSYGLVQTLPLDMLVTLRIPMAGVDLSQDESKAYWTGPFLWDDYWVNALGPIPAFNPNIGAQVYANRWLPLLTGANGLAMNLTADGKLPRGTYTVYYTETWPRTFTGLDLAYDDLGNPLTTPWHAYTATYVNDPYIFKVGPPKK
jgi:hypothetical protein